MVVVFLVSFFVFVFFVLNSNIDFPFPKYKKYLVQFSTQNNQPLCFSNRTLTVVTTGQTVEGNIKK